MNLKLFLQSVITEPKHAGKLTCDLIDMLEPTKNNEKLVLEFFNSLPQSMLQDKNLTEVLISSFFTKYNINENNINYYNQYIHSNYHKENIIAKNPDWQFEQTVFQYDTLKELLMNFQSACSRRNNEVGYNHSWYQEDGLKFIEENKISFKKFSKVTKKFEDTLIKKNFVKFLIETGYDNFKNFCDKNNMDFKNIIKKTYSIGDTYYGFSSLITTMMHHKVPSIQLENLMDDIMPEKDNIFGNNNKFLKIDYNQYITSYRYHVSDTFMECVLNENFEYAHILMKNLKPEILEGLHFWAYGNKNIQENEYIHQDIDNILLNKTFESLKNLGKNMGSFNVFTIKDKKVLGQFEHYYNQKKSLVKKRK